MKQIQNKLDSIYQQFSSFRNVQKKNKNCTLIPISQINEFNESYSNAFFSWNCSNQELNSRALKLFGILKKLCKSNLIEQDGFVAFENTFEQIDISLESSHPQTYKMILNPNIDVKVNLSKKDAIQIFGGMKDSIYILRKNTYVAYKIVLREHTWSSKKDDDFKFYGPFKLFSKGVYDHTFLSSITYEDIYNWFFHNQYFSSFKEMSKFFKDDFKGKRIPKWRDNSID